MDSYSRFYDVVADARGCYAFVEREAEAAEQRPVRQLRTASPWRAALAAQLRRLAERLEPQPEPKESSV